MDLWKTSNRFMMPWKKSSTARINALFGSGLSLMSTEAGEHLANMANIKLRTAFSQRVRPSIMSDSMQLTDSEYAEVMSFEGMDWREVTFEQIQRNPDAVFWFAPEAFRFYLPGFLIAGIEAQRTDTNAYDSLIGMLDRSAEPAYWDDFFEPRWTKLNENEIDAVSAWVDWLQEFDPGIFFHANTCERVQETLKLLKGNQAK